MAGEAQREKTFSEKEYFRIGEVSRITATKPFVLRYWETEFPMLRPVKTPKGHRLYRREDIETVLEIKRLLYDEGFTIAGARRHFMVSHAEPLRESAAAGGASQGSPRERREESAASVSRRVLLELRDELRAILTLLERR
jgi:DNA-binding transcriptional MerR regulator